MIDPVGKVALDPEFQVSGIAPDGATQPKPAQSFGGMLQSSLDNLEGALQNASDQSTALATGKADDLTGVVVAVERAQLGLQLAVQIRNKAVEAYQDIFRMQI
jgi:flagellar hook-basal body complex protein FliE